MGVRVNCVAPGIIKTKFSEAVSIGDGQMGGRIFVTFYYKM